MKEFQVKFGEINYTIKITHINSAKPQYIVIYISPEFNLHNPIFEIDHRTKTVNFHRSEFHKKIWTGIQDAFELQPL